MKPPSPFERPLDKEPDHEPQWSWENASEKDQPNESEKPDKRSKKAKKKTQEKEQETKEEKLAPQKEKKEKAETKRDSKESQHQEKTTEADEEKEQKRALLVEQSTVYAKHFEENPLPRDPTTLARLLIAQHVLAVHEQLEHPANNETTDPARLLATLDYMGALDDKFQDPSVEASPDIEEAYEEILQLARETLQEGENLEDVVATNSANIQQDFTTQPTAPGTSPSAPGHQTKTTRSDTKTATPPPAHTAGAASLMYAIANFRDRKKQPDQSPSLDSQASLSDIADRIPPSPYSAKLTPESSRYPVDNTARPSYRETATPRPTTAREYAPINQPERTISSRKASPAILAATAIATAAAVSRRPESRPGYPETIQPPTPQEHPSTKRPETTTSPLPEATSSRKIEHMSLNTLLQMAETVPIGHGRYLRRAYETGLVDKEGLIKILKSHKKGRDFFVEYRQQEARVRALRAQSPEFLPASTAAVTATSKASSDQPSNQPSPETTIKKTPESNETSAASPSPSHTLLPSIAQATRNKPHTAWRLVVITLATIALISLLGVITFGLYSGFFS